MLKHAYDPITTRTLCDKAWNQVDKNADDFDEAIKVDCPTCRFELDKRALKAAKK